MKSLCSVTITYNPTKDLIRNILSFGDYVDNIIIIDNAGLNNLPLFPDLDSLKHKIKIISPGENLGISKALNIAVTEAKRLNSDFLLTMDQDSYFENFNSFKEEVIKNLNRNIGIYSPAHITGNRKYPNEKITFVESVMTSGNILSISIFEKLGGMDENLFIDRVDHDYCARVIRHGFKIIRFNDIHLKHDLGDIRIIRGKEITNHSPLRRYYITRNTLYLAKKTLSFDKRKSLGYIKGLLSDISLVFLYEQDRCLKAKFILSGFCDFLKGKFGSKP